MSLKSALAAVRRLTMEQPLQTATAHPAGTRGMAVQMKRKRRKRNTAAVVSGTMVAESSLTSSYAITTMILVALGIRLRSLHHHAPVVAVRQVLQAMR